ncbi:MAG: hypothetical protein RI885_285 [Actinomycetota bacterium]
MKAQQTPVHVAVGSAETVKSLTDRRWFKVKTSHFRGVAGAVGDEMPSDLAQFDQQWWLCAGGVRSEDSPQLDFYAKLKAEAHRAGPHSCSTEFLLPVAWDHRRLSAEAAVNAVRVIHELVLDAAAESLINSDIRGFTIGDRDVRVRIKVHRDGQAYIAIGAVGSIDAAFVVTLLSAIPSIPSDDWMAEPAGGLEIDPEHGEILWSTMLPPQVQQTIATRGSLQ